MATAKATDTDVVVNKRKHESSGEQTSTQHRSSTSHLSTGVRPTGGRKLVLWVFLSFSLPGKSLKMLFLSLLCDAALFEKKSVTLLTANC